MDSIEITDTTKAGKIVKKDFVNICDNNNNDRKEILFDGYFYDVTDFIPKHPGGSIIKYYTQTGEDSTHAIQQFHLRSIKRVKGIMSSFKKRPASDNESNLWVSVVFNLKKILNNVF